jgi:hypothetical protein
MTDAAYAALALILAGCIAYAACVLGGRERLACLRCRTALRALVITTLLAIGTVLLVRSARHPLRYARYLTARAFRRIPRQDPDGEPLDRGEWHVFITVVEGWRHPASSERSRT